LKKAVNNKRKRYRRRLRLSDTRYSAKVSSSAQHTEAHPSSHSDFTSTPPSFHSYIGGVLLKSLKQPICCMNISLFLSHSTAYNFLLFGYNFLKLECSYW